MTIQSTVAAVCPPVVRSAYDRLRASPIGYRLASGMFWLTIGAVVSRGLMLAASAAVAHLLGKIVYGEFGMIQTTVTIFGTLAGFGLGVTATKHIAEFRQSAPERAGRILGMSGIVATISGGVVALALALGAPWLAEHSINAPHLAGDLRVGALVLFLTTLNGAQTGALSGFEAFRTIARVNVLTGLLSFPILVGGAWLGGLSGAIWGLAIHLGFTWLVTHLALRREARRFGVPIALREGFREWRILWSFSLPAILAGSMTGPVNWVCGAMLVNQPDGYGEMGIYSAANQWFTLLLFLATTLGNVVLPILAHQVGQNDLGHSTKTMVLVVKANLLLVAPLVVTGSIASPYLMGLYGPSFTGGWPTLVVALWTALLVAVQTPVGQFLAASGKMWTGYLMNLGWAITFVLGTFLLVYHGALGVAAARGAGYALHTAWVLCYALYLLRKHPSRNIG
jgi:O-antigen/teichoic acid export membrane protein